MMDNRLDFGKSSFTSFQVLNECENGCNWADAAWVVAKYIELQERCDGTDYYDERKYTEAKEIYNECDRGNSWSDASWAVQEYIEKMDLLRSELGLAKKAKKRKCGTTSDDEDEEEK